MNPSRKYPNLFNDDSDIDSDDGYAPSRLRKGKRKAEGVSRVESSTLTETDTGGALRAFGKRECRPPLPKFLSCTLSS